MKLCQPLSINYIPTKIGDFDMVSNYYLMEANFIYFSVLQHYFLGAVIGNETVSVYIM